VGLLHSENPENHPRGISLLKAVYTSIQKVSKFFSDVDKDLARHCLYQLTLGCFKLKKFDQAIEYGTLLLHITPNHQQAKAIISLIQDNISSPAGREKENGNGNRSPLRRQPRKADTVNEKKLGSGNRPEYNEKTKSNKKD